VERFRTVCDREPLVVAAFLGGSHAAGTARENSDVDLYVVALEEDYPSLWSRRHELIRRAWGGDVSTRDVLDFEGLGFDMVLFELADGVDGEVAFGDAHNFIPMHGGPYEVLVDRAGLLDGVEFPLR
jgi:predicted nucleotidyltransferase